MGVTTVTRRRLVGTGTLVDLLKVDELTTRRAHHDLNGSPPQGVSPGRARSARWQFIDSQVIVRYRRG